MKKLATVLLLAVSMSYLSSCEMNGQDEVIIPDGIVEKTDNGGSEGGGPK